MHLFLEIQFPLSVIGIMEIQSNNIYSSYLFFLVPFAPLW